MLVEGDRIAAVGKDVSPGARVLDLGDATLLPGLIDLHTHLSIGIPTQATAGPDFAAGPADFAIQAAENARATLLAGFTSVREVGASDFIDVALKRAVERGLLPGPRITPAGYPIRMTGGHGDDLGLPPGAFELGPRQGVADGPEQLLFAVRYQIKHGAEIIKLTATAGVLGEERTATARQFSDAELAAIVGEAHRHGLKVAAHAHGAEGVLAAVLAGVDSIEHGSQLTAEAVAEMKRRGTFLVPTIYVGEPAAGTRARMSEHSRAKGEAMAAAAAASHRRAIAAGVRIGFGTDAGVFPHGLNAREFRGLVDRGLAPLDAVRAATIWAAELLGAADRGVLDPGRLADLVAVAGDPLADVAVLERVGFVMIGGRVVKDELSAVAGRAAPGGG